MERARIAYLDYLRILACVMVVIMHAPMPGIGTPGYVLTGISFFSSPCIGLFFMISGALLLPVSVNMKVFYKNRLPKIVIATILWTIVYLVATLLKGSVIPAQLPKMLLSIPFSAQGSGILWFMYTLIGLYLLSPIISPWLQNASRKEIEFILLLWTLSLLYPMLSNIVFLNQGETGSLYYFSGYAGYFLLGYYLNKFKPKINRSLSFLMIVLPIMICGVCITYEPDIDFYKYFWYLSVFVAAMALGWFTLLSGLSLRENLFITRLSSLTLGVYLSHLLIMRSFIWELPFTTSFGWAFQIFFSFIASLFLSLLVSFMASLLPIGRYVVGYHYK